MAPRKGMRDHNGWANVVWIDPGETSGWCVLSVDAHALADPKLLVLNNIVHWSAGQIVGDLMRQCDESLELFEVWEDAAIGTEAFTLRQFRMDETLLSPSRINLVLEYGLHVRKDPRTLFTQQSSMAMTTMTDERLKDAGLWPVSDPGGHGRDATRHAVTFLRRAKKQPRLRRQAWPHLFDPKGGIR